MTTPARKKSTTRKQSLRQRLRVTAEAKLDGMVEQAKEAVYAVVKDSGLPPSVLHRLAVGSQTKSVRYAAISHLADVKEAALEEIYNTQQELLPEESKK